MGTLVVLIVRGRDELVFRVRSHCLDVDKRLGSAISSLDDLICDRAANSLVTDGSTLGVFWLIEGGLDNLTGFLCNHTMSCGRSDGADSERSDHGSETRVNHCDIELNLGQEALRLVGDLVGERGLVHSSVAVRGRLDLQLVWLAVDGR